MLLALLAPLALAQEPKLPGPVDLDGDGTKETLSLREGEVLFNGKQALCGDEVFACEVQVIDLRSGDRYQELLACQTGVRDEVDCSLWAVRKGAAQEIRIPLPGEYEPRPSAVSASGSGIVLADLALRAYTQRHKLVLSKDGLSLSYVAQPYYAVGRAVHVDRSLPITMEAGAGAVVANVRADSDIQVELESASKPGHVLVTISSGLVGWTTWDALTQASDELMALMAAG